MALNPLQKDVVTDLVEHHWSHIDEISKRLKRMARYVQDALNALEKSRLVEREYFTERTKRIPMLEVNRKFETPERSAGHGVLKTGFKVIDEELMRGFSQEPLHGIPRGGFYEIYGPRESGKSRLAYHIMAAAQAQGDECVLCDAEGRLKLAGGADYVRALGLSFEPGTFGYMSPSDENTGVYVLEDVMLTIQNLAVDRKNGKNSVGVVAVDSVPALVPRADKDHFETTSKKKGKDPAEFSSGARGVFAQSLQNALRQTIPACVASGMTVIIVNHERQDPRPYRAGYAPGGSQKDFLLNACFRLSRKGYDPETGDIESVICVMKSNVSAQSTIKTKIVLPGPRLEAADDDQ